MGLLRTVSWRGNDRKAPSALLKHTRQINRCMSFNINDRVRFKREPRTQLWEHQGRPHGGGDMSQVLKDVQELVRQRGQKGIPTRRTKQHCACEKNDHSGKQRVCNTQGLMPFNPFNNW